MFRLAFWLALTGVTVLSLLPGPYLPSVAFNVWDKAQHALAFLGLTGFGLLAYSRQPTRIIVGLLVYGALIEIIQEATGWRTSDWQDWLADAIGVVAAYLVWRGYLGSRKRTS